MCLNMWTLGDVRKGMELLGGSILVEEVLHWGLASVFMT